MKIFSILLCLIPSLALALNNQPPSPSLNNLSDYSSCRQYINTITQYLKTTAPDNHDDALNYIWFEAFENQSVNISYKEKCLSFECRVEYGPMHGCDIAGLSTGQPIDQLLYILNNAYNTAMTHDALIQDYYGQNFSLAGIKDICSDKNKYQDCNVVGS